MLEWLPFSIWLPFIKKYKSFNFIYKTYWERDKPDYGDFLSREKGKWLFSSTVIKQFNEMDGISIENKYPRGITKDVYNSIWGSFYHSSFIHSFNMYLIYIFSQIVLTFCTGYTIAHLIARGFPYNPGDLVSLLGLFQLILRILEAYLVQTSNKSVGFFCLFFFSQRLREHKYLEFSISDCGAC